MSGPEPPGQLPSRRVLLREAGAARCSGDAELLYTTGRCSLQCLFCFLTRRRGEVIDSVVMEAKNYGFVTFKDPASAMAFLEVSH